MNSNAAKTKKAAKAPSRPEPPAGRACRPLNRSSHESSSCADQKPTPACNVVRGFSTSHIPIFQTVTSQPKPAAPIDPISEPSSSPQAKLVQPKKQQATFALGGSSSCDDSLSDRGNNPDIPRQPFPQIKRNSFQVGGSSEEENSLKSAVHSARSGTFPTQKKQTSFSNQLVTRTIPAPAIDNDQSETEADEVDESAIDDDDDDSSDWEDSNEESGKSSIDEKTFFQRVDSKVNLASRRSLIMLMFERNDRQVKLGNGAWQSPPAIHQGRPQRRGPSSSPNNSNDNPFIIKRGSGAAHLEPINDIPRSTAQPILTPSHNTHHQAALSPRTTRRNMLSTELTDSLRRHLVWERSQKLSTVNAVLKRRHTSHDVANLKQYPDKVVIINPGSYDQYFGRDAGYHSKGW